MTRRKRLRRGITLLAVGLSLLVMIVSPWHVSTSGWAGSDWVEEELINLDYLLAIDNPSSGQAKVTMTIEGLSEDAFEVEEQGWHGIYIDVLALSAYDDLGNPLIVQHLPDSGTTWMGRMADVWQVQCAGLSSIIIQYDVRPVIRDAGDQYIGYIGPEFAVLAGEYVFLRPRKHHSPDVDTLSVSFQIPPNWLAYTPWQQHGSSYYPGDLNTNSMDSLTVSTFALGQFDLYTRTVGSTDVAVAAYSGWPASTRQDLAHKSWSVVAHQTSIFGASVGDRYLAIFCPPAPDGRPIIIGEWSTSQGYSIWVEADGSYDGQWEKFAHQAFHRWNVWAWGMHGFYHWFYEGPTELYDSKTATRLRLFSRYDQLEIELEHNFAVYLSEYVAPGKDRPLASPDLDSFLKYRKSMMAMFLLAKEVYLRTDGAHTLDDFMRILFQKYGYHAASCSEACMQAELEALTGTSFAAFFNDYIYGTVTLPMGWAFVDDDGDGLSNALEIGWDTHPGYWDTDEDGHSDGEEVTSNSDPLDPCSPYCPLSSLSGQVIDEHGAPMTGVQVSAGADTNDTTDSGGYYELVDLKPGTYGLTPTMAGCLFSPASRTVLVPPSATGKDFVGRCEFDVSGSVRHPNGSGLAGVTVSTSSGQSTVTNPDGTYTIRDLPAATHVLTPTLPGYKFRPATRAVIVPPDVSGQTFTVLARPVSLTLTAGMSATLSYSDTQGLFTRLDFPADAVTEPTTIVLTPTLAYGGGGFAFAGHAFELSAFGDGRLLPSLGFGSPVTLTIQYSDADLRVVTREDRLATWRKAESGWGDAADTCTPPSTYQRDMAKNLIRVPLCHVGLFGLFGPTNQVHMPGVFRDN